MIVITISSAENPHLWAEVLDFELEFVFSVTEEVKQLHREDEAVSLKIMKSLGVYLAEEELHYTALSSTMFVRNMTSFGNIF